MLNAFRHQRGSHVRDRLGHRARVRCSTPFGINGEVTGVNDSTMPGAQTCSTPFGINGEVTAPFYLFENAGEIQGIFKVHCGSPLEGSILGHRDQGRQAQMFEIKGNTHRSSIENTCATTNRLEL